MRRDSTIVMILNRMTILAAFSPIFTFIVSGCAVNKINSQQITVKSSFTSPKDLSHNNASVQVEIYNGSKSEILVPELLYWGIPNDPIADIIFEIQKKDNKGEFYQVDIPDNYNPSFEPVSLVKLPINGIRRDTSNIAFFYSYNMPKGTYRIRVLYKISNYNNSGPGIYSNWTKFTIK